MPGALDTLLRLRRLEARLARVGLAEAVAGEQAAGKLLADAKAAPVREAAIATEGGAAGASFAAWLGSAAVITEQCAAQAVRAQAALVAAAEDLNSRKRAEEAVESLVEAKRVQARRAAQRKAQLELDDMAGRRRR